MGRPTVVIRIVTVLQACIRRLRYWHLDSQNVRIAVRWNAFSAAIRSYLCIVSTAGGSEPSPQAVRTGEQAVIDTNSSAGIWSQAAEMIRASAADSQTRRLDTTPQPDQPSFDSTTSPAHTSAERPAEAQATVVTCGQVLLGVLPEPTEKVARNPNSDAVQLD